HQAQAVVAIGEVLVVGDALDPLGLYRIAQLLREPFGTHLVRQLGDHDALAARGDVLDPRGGAHLERAATGAVRVAHAVQTHDPPTGGQVRSRHEAHQLLELRLRVVDQVPRRGDGL